MKKHKMSTTVNILIWIGVALFVVMDLHLALTSQSIGEASKYIGTLLSLSIMTWGFFNTKPTDFWFFKNQSYFRPGLLLLQILLIICISLDSYYLGACYVLFATYQIIDNYRLNKIWAVPASTWRQESSTSIPLEVAVKILNERFTAIDIRHHADRISVRARQLLMVEVQMELYPQRSTIQVQFQQTSVVFAFGLKLLPVSLGVAYEKMFLAAVNEAKEIESLKTL